MLICQARGTYIQTWPIRNATWLETLFLFIYASWYLRYYVVCSLFISFDTFFSVCFFFRVCVCVLCPTECAALNMKLSKLSKNILIQLETSQPRVLNVEFLFVIAVEGSSVEENSPKISKTTKMVFDCGVWCAKYLLCIFNFIFFVSTDEVMWEGGLLCYMHQVMHMGNAQRCVHVIRWYPMPHRPSIQIPLQLNQANLCACAGAFCIFPHFQLGGGGSLTFSQHRHHHHNHHYHHVDCQTSSSAFSNAIKMGRQRHNNNNNHQTAFACPAGGTMLCFCV